MQIQNWIQTSGFVPVQNVLIEVDAACQVEISSLADTECTSQLIGSSDVAVVGSVVGGVVIVLIIATTIIIIVVVILVFKNRRGKLIIHKTTRYV